MKTYKYLSKLMVVAIGAVAFASCSSDDDLENYGQANGNTSEGTNTLNEHEYVDLGLPSGTLWATCNVGASKPEEYGLYFAWGETTGYSVKGTGNSVTVNDGHLFYWTQYKWCKGSSKTMTKYCTSSNWGTVDNKTELESADDAATANWGNEWQMPSFDQIKELYNSSYTTTEWTTMNGVYGRKITSKNNNNSIFLPAAGYRYDSSIDETGSYGIYWSRSLDSDNSCEAWSFDFDKSRIDWEQDMVRDFGLNVRPVRVGTYAQETTPTQDQTTDFKYVVEPGYTYINIKLYANSNAPEVNSCNVYLDGTKKSYKLSSSSYELAEYYGLEPGTKYSLKIEYTNSAGQVKKTINEEISTKKITSSNYCLLYGCVNSQSEEYYDIKEIGSGVQAYLDDVSTAKHYYEKYIYFSGYVNSKDNFCLRISENHPYYEKPSGTWSDKTYSIIDTSEDWAHFFNGIKMLLSSRYNKYVHLDEGTTFKKSTSGSVTTYEVKGTIAINKYNTQKVLLHAVSQK